MDIFIRPDGQGSLVSQIYDQLRDAITDGRLPVGTRLTPSRVLATELEISRATVTEAYTRLVAEGFVEGRRGGGTVVAGRAMPRPETPSWTAIDPTPEAAAVRRYGADVPPMARFDLTAGRIDARLFPANAWRRCVLRALRVGSDAVGRYGEPVGSPALRRALTRWITQSRGISATPGQVVATQGTGQTLDLLARAILQPGDVAVVEEPGYPPVTSVLHSQRIDIVGVPVDRHGLVVDALPDRARLVHVTPSHQYPLGSVLSRDRRLALLDWASRNDAVIVEDDYDSEFRYGRRPLEPLQRLDRRGRVVYVGTFSKTLSPTLRMGFAIVPPGLVATLTVLRKAMDSGPPGLIDAALTTFIDEGHLSRHVRRSRKVYTERHRAAWHEINHLATGDVVPLPTQAGLHLTLLAPRAPDDDELVARAAEHDLLFSSLRRTYQFSEPRAGVILGFGAIATADVPSALRRLMECLRAP